MTMPNQLTGRAGVSTMVLLSLLVACAKEEPADETTPISVAVSDIDDATWTEELIQHRTEYDEYFKTSPTSPMAGVQYLKSAPIERVYLTRDEGTFGMADTEAPAAVLVVEKSDEQWVWHSLEEDVVGNIEGTRLESGTALEETATFSIADYTVRFHPAEDRVTFVVFDPDRPALASFEHLLYFPPDRAYAVPARLVTLPEPEALEMPTTRGLIKTLYRYAKIDFELDGEKQELTAFKYGLEGDAAQGLFIPFKDATTGRETYGAGRYLQIDDPENELFILDFNYAFNPLCNYAPAYNCTLPPYENHLEVAIKAGELAYPH